MEDDSKLYLTTNMNKGLSSYNRQVFRVALAPALWQHTMDQVLQGVPGTQCYLDDITVIAATDATGEMWTQSQMGQLWFPEAQCQDAPKPQRVS